MLMDTLLVNERAKDMRIKRMDAQFHMVVH